MNYIQLCLTKVTVNYIISTYLHEFMAFMAKMIKYV